jgi:hypothetical protein
LYHHHFLRDTVTQWVTLTGTTSMSLELDPEEERALVAELRRLIADDRYPLSRRIRMLQGILDKLVPPPVREPLPPPEVYARQAEPASRPPVKPLHRPAGDARQHHRCPCAAHCLVP